MTTYQLHHAMGHDQSNPLNGFQMPRKILEASLFHAEPRVIHRLKGSECNHMSVAWRVREDEIVVQVNRFDQYPGTLYEAPFKLWEEARSQGYDGVRFHKDGPIVDHEIFDRDLVFDALKHEPIEEDDVCNQWADEALETLHQHKTFSETPSCYERMALWNSDVLRKLDFQNCDRRALDDMLEESVCLGHASGRSKWVGRNYWNRCDNALRELVNALDHFLLLTADEWGREVAWLEGIVFAAQFSLSQSIRASAAFAASRPPIAC